MKKTMRPLKSFTNSNARENLTIFTDIVPSGGIHVHHIFPQKLIEEFLEKGINIHDPKHLTWWNADDHLKNTDLGHFHDEWVKVVDKGFCDYSSLTDLERAWFNIQSLISLVSNGGLISYYYNSGANYLFETIDDLSCFGNEEIAKLLMKINSFFLKCDISNEFKKRNEIISNWDGKYDLIFNDLDKEFFKRSENLEKALVCLYYHLFSRNSTG